MKLSSQIIGSVVGITALAQIVFGSIAYIIMQEHHGQPQHNLNKLILQSVSKNWDKNKKPDTIKPYLDNILKQTTLTNSIFILHGKDRTIISGDNNSEEFKYIPSKLKNKTSGTIDISNKNHYWNAITLPDQNESLVLISKTTGSSVDGKYTLSTRLISIGIIIMWIAVWIALILSSMINKRIKEKNDALNYQALHDKLTGLPNRISLKENLDQAQIEARRKHEYFALLIMDLDNFKEINDALGHISGDILLNKVGQRIKATLRDADTLARLGGDEFAMILPGSDHDKTLQHINDLLDLLKTPVEIDDTQIVCKASIGISLYPQNGKDTETLLKRADIAMYHAKKIGYSYAFYDSKHDFNSVRKLQQKNELRKAIDNNEIDVHYQPMINQKNGRTTMVEALARWHHKEHGFISPEEFIRTAEQTGTIHELTLLIARKALSDCKQWNNMGHTITIAVNISTYCLQDKSFPEKLMFIVDDIGMPADNIELEITESALMQDVGSAREMLQKLHDTGFKLAIDDFGTGYSSLEYLKDFPVSTLKIDKSFVFQMCADKGSAAIVHSVIGLAHNLNCKVIAEGVEDEQTLMYLHQLNNDIAQGYLISKPIPAEDLTKWLETSTWNASPDIKVIDKPVLGKPKTV